MDFVEKVEIIEKIEPSRLKMLVLCQEAYNLSEEYELTPLTTGTSLSARFQLKSLARGVPKMIIRSCLGENAQKKNLARLKALAEEKQI